MAMSRQAKQLYEFGPFRIDIAERQLMRDGNTVSLTPKAFDTLMVLIENRGHLLEKKELMDRLWPDTFVEETNLSNNISMLRKVLGDDSGEHRYIETVPRRGYRFIAAVASLSDQSPVWVVEEKIRSTLTLEQEEESEPAPTHLSRAIRARSIVEQCMSRGLQWLLRSWIRIQTCLLTYRVRARKVWKRYRNEEMCSSTAARVGMNRELGQLLAHQNNVRGSFKLLRFGRSFNLPAWLPNPKLQVSG